MDGLDLRVIRVRAGLNQHAVAQGAGLSISAISHYETGFRDLTPERLGQLVTVIERLHREKKEAALVGK